MKNHSLMNEKLVKELEYWYGSNLPEVYNLSWVEHKKKVVEKIIAIFKEIVPGEATKFDQKYILGFNQCRKQILERLK